MGRHRTVREAAYFDSPPLQRFEAELHKASNSAALIQAMNAAYPAAGLGIALEIGAKVNKGKMKW